MQVDVGTALGTGLICGVPGLIVWVTGQILVFARVLRGRRKSPLGLRLTMAGLGLSLLGMFGYVVVAAFVRGLWPVAVAVLVLVGWQPILLFWWATRRHVAIEEPD